MYLQIMMNNLATILNARYLNKEQFFGCVKIPNVISRIVVLLVSDVYMLSYNTQYVTEKKLLFSYINYDELISD